VPSGGAADWLVHGKAVSLSRGLTAEAGIL
jgi:hypothetical protein